MTNMIDIGSEITYIIRTKEDTVQEGKGIVKAIFLDPFNRKSVQVVYKNTEDKDEVQNVLWEAINPTKEFKAKFTDLIAEVKVIAAEGNEKVTEIVKDYNKRVEEKENTLLGLPVKLMLILILLFGSQAHADQYSKQEMYERITSDIQPSSYNQRPAQQRYMFEQPQQVQTPQSVDRSYEYKYRRDDNCTSLHCAR